MAVCGTCGERIVWAVTPAGKSMPLDGDPNLTKGNVRVAFIKPKAQATILGKADAEMARRNGEMLYLSHFVNCRQAKKWRRR
ncbi:hypothetical protein SEA_LILBEANIE_49 [Gordonia phage Lilbeanie]|uniref:Uncharacterized protein n=1 Tax=Gordonia phage Lilbeanie TaxID=2794947 RepID=A0A7T1KSC8_9CAUD|nr:hypothetical protein J1773_gp49 [Gordonia phage Lilbeanie]QPO17127.1 hypothetical protein SEA_LILBEANIE_49 [Gordonia phage Lilbeanie]